MPTFETLGVGDVTRLPLTADEPVCSGPRVAVTRGGVLLCSYMRQSKLAINDFVPYLASSRDGGATWDAGAPIWPQWRGRWSVFANLSATPAGELAMYGSRTAIVTPGESFWSDATAGLMQNELTWAISGDEGRTWPTPSAAKLPIPGSAEAPGPLCVTRAGRWVGPYSPYNTFDPAVKVDRGQVVVVLSDDKGKTWHHRSMLRFAEAESGGAEAWVVELADGRLLGTSWHTNLSTAANKAEYTNKFALSHDGGETWTPTRSTGVMGHTTALTPLPDGRVIFTVVKRSPASDIGIWMAVCKPTDADLGIQSMERVWSAQSASTRGESKRHEEWTSYNFGEPSAAVLKDGTVVLALWYGEKEHAGVRCVRLRMKG
ncbi:MAG: glycoside hydrolase [Planctomycetes bacterium]|nr:glycoside hydrolase [Planctomycetota bacterium]